MHADIYCRCDHTITIHYCSSPVKSPSQPRKGFVRLMNVSKHFKQRSRCCHCPPLKGLTLAARDHVKDQGRTGAIGHTGSDSSTVVDRLNRYGKWGISAGENIYYGNGDARIIVVLLLIDDGVSSRGHRGNLLDSSFKVVGVSVGPHPLHGYMCVMDFAGSYE